MPWRRSAAPVARAPQRTPRRARPLPAARASDRALLPRERRAGGHDLLDLDLRAALADEAELVGRGVGDVDGAAGVERSAIVDAHHHAPAVGEVGDARVARDRQDRVRGGHLVHVVLLAAGGRVAVVALAIPARRAALLEDAHLRERHVLAAHGLVGTVGIAVQRLGLRHGVRHGGNARGIARPVVLVVAAGALLRRGAAAGDDDQRERDPPHASWTTLPATMVARTRPASSRPRKGVFLPWLLSAAGVTRQAALGSKSTRSPGAPGSMRPEVTPRMRAGSLVMRASVCASVSFLSIPHLSASGSRSSSPVAPGSASAKGRSFWSSSTGVWSDTAQSMVPSASAAASASRSRRLRSGGSRRQCESK